RPDRGAGRGGPPGRAGRPPHRAGRTRAGVLRPGGAGRLPDRAGGADQRPPARRRLLGAGGRRARARRAVGGGGRRRDRRSGAAGGGQRAARDARAGGRARRRVHRRPPPRRRLPGPRRAPRRGCGHDPRLTRPHACAPAPRRAVWGRPPGRGPTRSRRPRMIRVVIADDQTLVRAGFRSMLEGEEDIEVVGEAADGAEAVALAARERPDVVLMDIRMPGVDGLEATRRIAADERLSAVRVVILTTFDLDEYVYGGLKSGAAGFLVKDTEPMELIHGVRVVARGDALLAPSVTRRLISEFAGRIKEPPPAPRLNSLTEREREVLSA